METNFTPRELNMPFAHVHDPDLLGYGQPINDPEANDFALPADRELNFS